MAPNRTGRASWQAAGQATRCKVLIKRCHPESTKDGNLFGLGVTELLNQNSGEYQTKTRLFPEKELRVISFQRSGGSWVCSLVLCFPALSPFCTLLDNLHKKSSWFLFLHFFLPETLEDEIIDFFPSSPSPHVCVLFPILKFSRGGCVIELQLENQRAARL